MAWQIELSEGAVKNLKQLDHQNARRILSFLHGRVAQLNDPRSIGEALKGSKLGELWKYRVGDYRIIADIADIADIEDGVMRVLVLKVGNRREVYRS